MVGLEIDERKIQLATEAAALQGVKNVHFKTLDAYNLADKSAYDLGYSRFLLSHLRRPKAVQQNIWQALQPNGLLLIEDTDFSGHFSQPASRAFNRYVSLYQRLLHQRGADASFGQKLPLLLHEMGFVDGAFQISQPVHITGEGKLMAEITFEGISKALIEEGLLSPAEARRGQRGGEGLILLDNKEA